MYKTVAELFGAYKTGVLTEPLILDNDSTTVYTEAGEKVFDMDPHDLLRQALGMLNIPYDEA
jgi:hypothetical protein